MGERAREAAVDSCLWLFGWTVGLDSPLWQSFTPSEASEFSQLRFALFKIRVPFCIHWEINLECAANAKGAPQRLCLGFDVGFSFCFPLQETFLFLVLHPNLEVALSFGLALL